MNTSVIYNVNFKTCCLQGRIMIHFSRSWHITQSLSSRSRSTCSRRISSTSSWSEFFLDLDLQWNKVVQNEGNKKSEYLQNYDKQLDMEKHPFILIITIYFINDCGLPLRTRNFFKSQWFKMPDLVRQSESLWSVAVL